MRFGSCGSNRRASSESRNPKAWQWCHSYTVPHHPIFLLAPYIPARPQNYSSFDNLLWWLQRWGGGWGEVEEVKLRQIERHRIYVFHIIVSIKCHFCSTSWSLFAVQTLSDLTILGCKHVKLLELCLSLVFRWYQGKFSIMKPRASSADSINKREKGEKVWRLMCETEEFHEAIKTRRLNQY